MELVVKMVLMGKLGKEELMEKTMRENCMILNFLKVLIK